MSVRWVVDRGGGRRKAVRGPGMQLAGQGAAAGRSAINEMNRNGFQEEIQWYGIVKVQIN